MSRMVRVLIAEEPVAGSRLSALVQAQKDMQVVEDLCDGTRLVERAVELTPDVVILDLAMPGGGLRALEQLADTMPAVRTIVLAPHEEISLLRSVLAVGALGYVVHRSARAEILSVIRKMAHGRGYVEVPTGGLTMDPGLDPRSETRRRLQERLDLLSKREREVLRAVAYGYTNREIAERLAISVKSIETYRFRLAEKLSFKSRADLVRFALEAGLLQMGGEGLP